MNRSTGFKNKMGGIVTNLTINPAFTADTTGWTATDSTLAAVSGELEITETGGINSGKAYQDIITEVGRLYKLQYSFKKGTSVSGSLKIGTVSVENAIFTSETLTDATITEREYNFIATETLTRITLISDSVVAGETSYFDEVRCENILDGFKDIFRNCRINFYNGTIPTTADDATTATILWQVSKDGLGVDGLTWENTVNGETKKSLTETWKGTVTTAGLQSWFRIFEENDDPALASTLNARIDGTIGISGADLNMPTLYAIENAIPELVYFSYKQQD